MPEIRPVAIVVIQHEGRLFVAQHDTEVPMACRPLGGRIEFGELGEQTIVRELREEIDAAVVVERYLATLENIFTHHGERSHELVRVYTGRFTSKTIYAPDFVRDVVEDGRYLFRACWVPIAAFRDGHAILYPTGLLDLLMSVGETEM